MRDGGVSGLVAGPVFKIGERQQLSLAGPIPVHLRHVLVLLAFLGGLAGLVACTSEDEPSATPSPTVQPTRTWMMPTPPPPPVVRTGAEACGFDGIGDDYNARKVRAYFPDGPAYAGSGVHPATLFTQSISNLDDGGPALPPEWDAHYRGPGTAQLVVCQYFDETYDGRRLDTCEYLGAPERHESGFYAARYVYRVFEAKTGKLAGTFRMNGTSSLEETCPETVEVVPEANYYQLVKSADLVKRLRPMVEGPVR